MRYLSTEELINKCAQRDSNAWGEFIRRYERLVIRSVNYKLNRLSVGSVRYEYQDIVQEIFLSIWNNNRLSGIKHPSSLKSWLVMVSINATLNYCTKKEIKNRNNTASLDQSFSREEPELTLGSKLSSLKLNTEKMIESSEIREAFKKELAKLNPKQQLVLKLNIYENKKHRDISEIMNIPLNTVSTLIRRGKHNLREGLNQYFGENIDIF